MHNNKNIRLAALDMDGTLLHDDKMISAYTFDVLNQLSQRGIILVPATGRQISGLRNNILRLPSIRYAICSNGAHVTDLHAGRPLFEACIPTEEAIYTLEYLARFPVVSYVHTNRKPLRSHQWTMELAKKFPHISFGENNIDNIPGYLRSARNLRIYKIGIFVLEDKSFRFLRSTPLPCPSIAAQCTGDGLIEYNSVNAGKGSALSALCHHLSIPVSQTLAIGDNENDTSMLRLAGVSAAMSSAPPEVRSCAQYDSGNNNQDGVAKFLAKFFEL